MYKKNEKSTIVHVYSIINSSTLTVKITIPFQNFLNPFGTMGAYMHHQKRHAALGFNAGKKEK